MELIQTTNKANEQLRDFFLVIGMSLLLTLSAWISIPLFFTPIPISFNAQLVLLFAAVFRRKGFYAVALYFIEGMLGLPVFANGGAGITYLMGPTGGYLIGFLISSFAVATLMEKIEEKTPAKLFGLMLFGNALIFAFGVPHLALFLGGAKALKCGLYPFIAGDLFKLLCAQKLLKR